MEWPHQPKLRLSKKELSLRIYVLPAGGEEDGSFYDAAFFNSSSAIS